MFFKTDDDSKAQPCVALDGTGGDNKDTRHVVDAVRFALAMCPSLYLIVFGSSELEEKLKLAIKETNRYEFRLAAQCITQDEPPRSVLLNYKNSAMYKAMECVKSGEAGAMISGGGTGPLVTIARHLLGVQKLNDKAIRLKERLGYEGRGGKVRPCFAARIPVGKGRFALMMDLGANATCSPADLYDFANLGKACASISLEISSPRVAILNIGTELGKGSPLVQDAKSILEQDRSINFTGFIEANRIFRNDADVIITDGFTGNVALKAAEGVADLYSSSGGFKRFFSKMSRPDWLLPWQYNGSVLLGVNAPVIKSHGSAGKEALAVAVVEAARAAQKNLSTSMADTLAKG